MALPLSLSQSLLSIIIKPNSSGESLALLSSLSLACSSTFSLRYRGCRAVMDAAQNTKEGVVLAVVKPITSPLLVYPLFAAVGVAVGICGMQLVSLAEGNRVTKKNRTAGVLENLGEGERYDEHGLKKFVHNKAPQIMPSRLLSEQRRREILV